MFKMFKSGEGKTKEKKPKMKMMMRRPKPGQSMEDFKKEMEAEFGGDMTIMDGNNPENLAKMREMLKSMGQDTSELDAVIAAMGDDKN